MKICIKIHNDSGSTCLLSLLHTVVGKRNCSIHIFCFIHLIPYSFQIVYLAITFFWSLLFLNLQMNNHNIFNASNTSFEPHFLMATNGEGAHVVLNCLSGSMINATFRCIAEFGKVVQLGKLDVKENTEIGMRIFLKNVSLMSVEAENIFNAPHDVKQRIQKLVADGLKKLVVRPLFRTVVNRQDVKSVLRYIFHIVSTTTHNFCYKI